MLVLRMVRVRGSWTFSTRASYSGRYLTQSAWRWSASAKVRSGERRLTTCVEAGGRKGAQRREQVDDLSGVGRKVGLVGGEGEVRHEEEREGDILREVQAAISEGVFVDV